MTNISRDIEKAVADKSGDDAIGSSYATEPIESSHTSEDDAVLHQVQVSGAELDNTGVLTQAASDDGYDDEENNIKSVAFSPTPARKSGSKRRARSNSILRHIKLPFSSQSLTSSALSSGSSSFLMTYVSPLYNHLAGLNEEEASERKATLFCGFCCDIVRGCIVINILQICLMTAFFTICLMDVKQLQEVMAINDFINNADDEKPSAMREILDPRGVVGLSRTALLIAVGFIGIVGARKFHKKTVLFAAIWYGIDVIPGLLIQAWTNVLLASFCCYAHVHFFIELRDGRITRDTYLKEKYCCCCRS